MEVENRGYKCGYFWQKWGGFRTLGSGHTEQEFFVQTFENLNYHGL